MHSCFKSKACDEWYALCIVFEMLLAKFSPPRPSNSGVAFAELEIWIKFHYVTHILLSRNYFYDYSYIAILFHFLIYLFLFIPYLAETYDHHVRYTVFVSFNFDISRECMVPKESGVYQLHSVYLAQFRYFYTLFR